MTTLLTACTSSAAIRRALALGWTGPTADAAEHGLALGDSRMIARAAVLARRYLTNYTRKVA